MAGEEKCGWFDIDSFPDGGGPPKSEHCTSGKPAIYRNCGFSVPVCEDHRCRCQQMPKVKPEPPIDAETMRAAIRRLLINDAQAYEDRGDLRSLDRANLLRVEIDAIARMTPAEIRELGKR